ncbi:hypothetical protein LINPERHAP1_LOCUS21376 [Linum perenne]
MPGKISSSQRRGNSTATIYTCTLYSTAIQDDTWPNISNLIFSTTY